MYATDFQFDDNCLSDFGMMICSFAGKSGTETVSSGSDITFHQIKAAGSNRFHLYSSSYDSAYSTSFQICKNPDTIKSPDEMYLSTELVSLLQRWLCRKEYKKFKLIQEDYENIYWNGTFLAKQINSVHGTAGMELTLYTDAPFAYSEAVTLEYHCLADTSFTLFDASDEIGFIHPDIEITLLSASKKFTLRNSMDYKILQIKNCSVGETLKIDGKNQIISTSVPSHTIANDFNYFFPKIINTYSNNQNTFTPNTDCIIKITYSPIKKIGL